MSKLLETFQELNLSNYGPDDVDQLNAWAIDAYAELAAIKEQEPVTNDESGLEAWAAGKFGAGGAFRGELCGNTDWALARLVWSAALAYAAPVSEAKAQGVVQWPEADEIMQMAFEEGQPADDASGYCFELEEFDLFIERLMSEVARLNAAHVQQPKCKTCDDNGRIGGPSFYAPDEAGDPCPDCSAPVQQVSVPASRDTLTLAYRLITSELKTLANGSAIDRYKAAQSELRAMLAAAPAAPAADAGLVEALEAMLEECDPMKLNCGEPWCRARAAIAAAKAVKS